MTKPIKKVMTVKLGSPEEAQLVELDMHVCAIDRNAGELTFMVSEASPLYSHPRARELPGSDED